MSDSGAEKQRSEREKDDIDMPYESSKTVDRERCSDVNASADAAPEDDKRLAQMISEIRSETSHPSNETCEALLQAFVDQTLSAEANRAVASMIDRDPHWSDAYERIVIQRAGDSSP